MRLSTLTLALLILCGSAGAQTKPADSQGQPQPPPIAQALPVLDPGKLEGRTYSNDFFGISFDVPEGWVVQSAAQRREVLDEGGKALESGATDTKKALMEAAKARTIVLLGAIKHERTSPDPSFNAYLSFYAERIPTAIVKTGEDYWTLAQRGMQGLGAKFEPKGPTRTERVGGAEFTVAEVNFILPVGSAAEKLYMRIVKNYAIVFIYAYSDEADVKTFEEVLKSVKFK